MDGRHCPSRGGNRDLGSAFYSLSVSTPPSEHLSTLTAPAQPPPCVPSEPQHLSFAKSVIRESSEDTAKKHLEKLNLCFFLNFILPYMESLGLYAWRASLGSVLPGVFLGFCPARYKQRPYPNPRPLVSLVASPTGHRRIPPNPQR